MKKPNKACTFKIDLELIEWMKNQSQSSTSIVEQGIRLVKTEKKQQSIELGEVTLESTSNGLILTQKDSGISVSTVELLSEALKVKIINKLDS